MARYKRIAQLRSAEAFCEYAASQGISIGCDAQIDPAVWGQPYRLGERMIGNRFCILPMEGWDGTRDGHPSELTRRRWRHFGASGAKLIWGGEAVAVRHDGRANPNQLVINGQTLESLKALREELVREHVSRYGGAEDLLVGLQLTHSGRFSRPDPPGTLKPVIAYHHPLLDAKFGVPADYPVISDEELDRLVEDFVRAARLAQEAGFHFVDIKHCHGYLGHELLSACERPGRYGGSFENRTRFLREVVRGVKAEAPAFLLGVRLSAFDFIPYQPGPDGVGQPAAWDGPYRFGFGVDPLSPATDYELTEPNAFLELLEKLGVPLVCITGGSPYYTPHIQRPALFPPSDGYLPPEDPLAGVARQIEVTARLKERHPGLCFVGSAYTYLQEFVGLVGQYQLRLGRTDFVGLGRMVLCYPELPADLLAGHELSTKRLCRTFSDCTSAPRKGLVSGCYPLDAHYKALPEAKLLK